MVHPYALLWRRSSPGGRRQALPVILGTVTGGQNLALATAHALLIGLWLLAWTVLVRRISRTLRQPRVKRAMARGTAVVFLALGMRTAAA